MVLGSLLLATRVTDLSIFVLNLATMLGLGLAVDYSLFVTSRFREELRRTQNDVPQAVERTIETAGQAVFFSGTTVLIGLLGLSLFEFMFLRSVGIAGVIVVAWSTFAALTLLPAIMSVLGPRIDRFSFRWRTTEGASSSGFWFHLSNAVMARPMAFLIPTLAVLLLLGMPFRHANISSPDATILPEDLPSRQAFDQLVGEFGAGEISPFVIVIDAPGRIWNAETLSEIYQLVVRLEADPRVARVQSVVSPNFSEGNAIAIASIRRWLEDQGVETGLSRLATPNAAVILAYTPYLPNDDRSKDLLRELRSLDKPGMEILVAGGAAEIVDSVNAMYADFPKAVVLVVAATYLVLLLLFRSLLLPLKAILMNALSILASYGALVWVFQDGYLSQWLGFSPLGFVEASLPIIMFCVLFGLSMDYEVFLLSRIREEWLRTGDNTRAVAQGMQRSGRIITSAALIVVVVTASFVTADVVIIKALGLGIAVAVFLDATIVRALLVPSTMKLLGEWNWWLPAPVQRLLPHRQWSEE
jgi:RND superfamily putative drug exporter